MRIVYRLRSIKMYYVSLFGLILYVISYLLKYNIFNIKHKCSRFLITFDNISGMNDFLMKLSKSFGLSVFIIFAFLSFVNLYDNYNKTQMITSLIEQGVDEKIKNEKIEVIIKVYNFYKEKYKNELINKMLEMDKQL